LKEPSFNYEKPAISNTAKASFSAGRYAIGKEYLASTTSMPTKEV
jgi:hypothetical protein